MTSKKKLILVIVLSILLIGLAAFGIYVSDYYTADSPAVAALRPTEKYEVVSSEASITFTPTENPSSVGIIFYPGGKVEAEAYSVLISQLAENGYTAIVVKMPFNLAFFGFNRADDVINAHPEIDSWVMAGHSLGGVFASEYAVNNQDKIEGVIYLAAYPSLDASQSSLTALSIRGSKDGLTSQEDIDSNQEKFPANTTFITLEGGNHYQFGNYGVQDGDNKSTISRQEQQQQTIKYILEFLENLHQ